MVNRRSITFSLLLVQFFCLSVHGQDKRMVKPVGQLKPSVKVRQPEAQQSLVPRKTGVVAQGDHFRRLALAVSVEGKILLTGEQTNSQDGNRNNRAGLAGFMSEAMRFTAPTVPYTPTRPSYLLDENQAAEVGNSFVVVFTDKGDGMTGNRRTSLVVIDSSLKVRRGMVSLDGFTGDLAVTPIAGTGRALIVWSPAGNTKKGALIVVDSTGAQVISPREFTRWSGSLSSVQAATTDRGTAIVLFTDADGLHSFEVDSNGNTVREIQPAVNNQFMSEAVPVPLPSGETMIIGNRDGIAQCVIIGRDDNAADYSSSPKPIRSHQLHNGPVESIQAELLGENEVLVTYFIPHNGRAVVSVVDAAGKLVRGPRELFGGKITTQADEYLATTRLRSGGVLVVGYVGKSNNDQVLFELY